MPMLKLTQVKAVSVKYIRARCGVRYWEDASVNGEPDDDGSRIPCRDGNNWCPTIDLDTGIIEGWPAGTVADIHYKVCDDGDYQLLDADRKVIKAVDGYVPSVMCPEGEGYGDYVIMTVDGAGRIANWDCSDLEMFETEP